MDRLEVIHADGAEGESDERDDNLNGEDIRSPSSPSRPTSLSSSPAVVETFPNSERDKVGLPFIKVESGNEEGEGEMESLSEGDVRSLENEGIESLDSSITMQDIHDQEPLEIQCGENTALMYLSKLCQGSKGPCILFHDEWITPNELQYISGRESAKDWKRSIRYKGKSLKTYIAHGLIKVHPPICDCQGCRISSPVLQRHTLRTGHSLQNRGRLASKYNYQPPSPRQRKDPSKHWGLDSDQPNRLPPLQMTLNPPTMVNGYGHSRYSEFGSSSDCPEVNSVTPGPSPFSPDTGKRLECSSPDGDRGSPSKRPRLSDTPTSQQQVIQGSERFQFDVNQSQDDNNAPQGNGLGNRAPESNSTRNKPPDIQISSVSPLGRDLHSWSKQKDRPYPPPSGDHVIIPTTPTEQSIVVYTHDIPGPYYPGVAKSYSQMPPHRSYPPSSSLSQQSDPRTCCGPQTSGEPGIMRDKRFNPRSHSGSRSRDAIAMARADQAESEIMGWGIDDVYKFVHNLTGSPDYAGIFKEQEIDGQALLLLDEDHLTIKLGIKLGPALKIRAKLAHMIHSKHIL